MAAPTLPQVARTALDVQGAVNLSGVLHSLDQIVTNVLWPEARRLDKGTEFVNSHPIITLFLHKLVSLNGAECFCSECIAHYSRTNTAVQKMAESVQP
jgi:hypothetical protein